MQELSYEASSVLETVKSNHRTGASHNVVGTRLTWTACEDAGSWGPPSEILFQQILSCPQIYVNR